MDSPTGSKTLGQEEDPRGHAAGKDVIQEIVWNLLQRFQGEDVELADVEAALSTAIADAGLPEQPQPWVEATALEIAGGREVVMDVKDQVEPEQVTVGDETVNVLAPPTGIPDKPGGPRPTGSERNAE